MILTFSHVSVKRLRDPIAFPVRESMCRNSKLWQLFVICSICTNCAISHSPPSRHLEEETLPSLLQDAHHANIIHNIHKIFENIWKYYECRYLRYCLSQSLEPSKTKVKIEGEIPAVRNNPLQLPDPLWLNLLMWKNRRTIVLIIIGIIISRYSWCL